MLGEAVVLPLGRKGLILLPRAASQTWRRLNIVPKFPGHPPVTGGHGGSKIVQLGLTRIVSSFLGPNCSQSPSVWAPLPPLSSCLNPSSCG